VAVGEDGVNRRSFFKFLAASATVVAVPGIALKPLYAHVAPSASQILGFLAGKEYGMSVMLPGPYSEWPDWTNDFLVEDARKYLPKGTVIEVRACIPTDFGRTHAAAWYTNSKIAVSEPTGLHGLEVSRTGGYFSAGTVRV
jgi:hypothetical protein